MATSHPIHTADPAYAPPVLRGASPASSLSSEYGPDETSLSEHEMTNEDFSRMCEDRILHGQRIQEEDPTHMSGVLLPKPKTTTDEKMLHDRVIRSLRAQVAALEQEELFEAAMRRGTQAAFQQQPSSHDIDVIMQSMLDPPTRAQHGPSTYAHREKSEETEKTVDHPRFTQKGKERGWN